MVLRLRTVLLCPPAGVGWKAPDRRRRWRELGYLHAPRVRRADEEFRRLTCALETAGCQIRFLEGAEGLTLDAVYVHDASLMTDHGAICLRMGKGARAVEPEVHRGFYRSQGIPVLGVMEQPGTAEAGDLVWLDSRTLLAGRGFRTNARGIEWLAGRLRALGVSVIPAPLPHGDGPESCLHLMSLLSVLDEKTVLADLSLLAVETVELLRARGFRPVEIDPAERATLAANVLALGDGCLLSFEENRATNARLRRSGFEITTIPGGEIGINGGGGPTCLTRPLLRS